MVLLQLFGVNDAKIAPNGYTVAFANTFELQVFLFGQVGHRALQFRDDLTWHKRSRGENTELRFPRLV